MLRLQVGLLIICAAILVKGYRIAPQLRVASRIFAEENGVIEKPESPWFG
jgi:hypothetical protein